MNPQVRPSVLLLLLAAAPASAQTPPKGAKSTPAPAPAAQAKTPSFKEAKLAAIDAWINANKASAERGDALSEAANLASELAAWQKTKGYAEVYLKELPKGEKALEMQLQLGRALGNIPGGESEAKKVFQIAIADAGDNVNAALGPVVELADLQCNLGDKDGAFKTLDEFGEKFSKVRGLKEFIKGKRAEIEEIGAEPKPIDVKGMDGKPIKLENFKGKVVLLDFWATWCGPCVAELPNVIATYKKYHAQGFEVVGISLDEDEQKLKDFLGKHEMPWVQFFDGKGWQNEVGQAYGVTSIPKTYLLDREGKVRRIGVRGDALGREVQKLLAAKPAAGK